MRLTGKKITLKAKGVHNISHIIDPKYAVHSWTEGSGEYHGRRAMCGYRGTRGFFVAGIPPDCPECLVIYHAMDLRKETEL